MSSHVVHRARPLDRTADLIYKLPVDGTLIVDGQPRGGLPNLVDVAPGTHLVEIRDAQNHPVARKRIRLAAGETYMLDDMLSVSGPRLEVLGGGFFRHGPGAGVLHPTALELQIRQVGFGKTPDWMIPSWGLRGSWASGSVEEQGPVNPVVSGALALGVGMGLKPSLLPLALGPQLDLVVPWRSFADSEGEHLQGTLTLAPGAALDARITLRKNRYVVLRYHGRIMPFEYAQVWTSAIEHGVSVGMNQR